jgi:tetratricopeptide (TPR) repeat protein
MMMSRAVCLVPILACLCAVSSAVHAQPSAHSSSAAPAPVPSKPQPQPPAQAKTSGQGKAPAKPAIPPLQDAEQKLANATDSQQAQTLARQAEALRQRGVSPTAQLLMRDGQHALEQHDMKTAEASMDDAIVLQPDAEILWRSRAQVRADAGDFAGAIADLGVALQRDPGDLNAWTMLSDTESDRHDFSAAYDAYEHVLTLNPLVKDGHRRLDKLKVARDGQPL